MTSEPAPEERQDLILVEQRSPKDRMVALTLGCFGGGLGLHRFYTGRFWSGLAMLLTLGGLMVWWVIDFFVLLTGRFKDSQGRVLGRPLAVRRDRIDQLPPEVRERIPESELSGARVEEDDRDIDDELLRDPLAEEFDELERNAPARRGTDGRA